MNYTEIFVGILEPITPVLVISGMLSLTISIIVMLVNMLIDAFTGKGFRIGLR